MKLSPNLMTAAALTAATLLASGTLLAANGMSKEMTRQQITQAAITAHPGSMVEHAVRIHKGDRNYWLVTLKEKSGKVDQLHLNPETGKPVS